MQMKIWVFVVGYVCTSACFHHAPPITPPLQATSRPTCPGEIFWPDWRELFERFAADRQFMHRYLFNGDEVWPKTVDFCARARNSLLDLAVGPGTALYLGLAGSAWESLLNTVAFTNAFERLSNPVMGSNWLYVWPMVSSQSIADMNLLMQAITSSNAIDLPKHLLFPSILEGPAQRFWPQSDQKDLQKAWNRRRLGATVHRLVRQAATMNLSFEGYELKNGSQRLAFYRMLDALPIEKRHQRLRTFGVFLEKQAAQRNLLFPAHRIQQELKRLLYTSLPEFAQPVPPSVVRALAEKNLTPELATHVARLEYITTGQYEGTRELPNAWKFDRQAYITLRSEVMQLQQRIATVAAWPSIKKIVLQQLERAPIVLSGNVYFATSHLEESFTGYTHNGFVLNLPSRPHDPWLFDRVQAFFYANPVRKLTKSALVELVAPDPTILNAPKHYAVVPYRVHTPLRLPGGSTDVINFVNMITDWKTHLPPQYELGPEFLWGAIHVLVNLPNNANRLRRFQYIKKIGQYSYIDYMNLRLLAGENLDFIARCKNP